MWPGQVLNPDQFITSGSGRYTFVYQGDGNLVLYKNYPQGDRRALWASNTFGTTTGVCIMQTDGNLVVYDRDANPLWASGTHGNLDSRLVMQDDGNAVIYRPDNVPVWATNTVQRELPSGPVAQGDTMWPGQVLNPGQSITSGSGRYNFILQGDGNLVLYKTFANRGPVALWASGTDGSPAVVCVMQADGNLVIYDRDANPLWASGTHGNFDSRLVMQNDGNAVIYRPDNVPVWASNTHSLIIHFKSLLAVTNAITDFINTQYNAMDELFIAGGVNVDMGTTEDLSGNAALQPLLDLNVGACLLGRPTQDHNTLFANRNGAGNNDIVVYIVRSLLGGTGNFLGCATHPDGQPGCAIVQSGARWLLAHEVGHVLGLRHVCQGADCRPGQSDSLMFPNVGWTNIPPDLSQAEYQTMTDSALTPVS
ncbi:MAG: hypothetical protein ICV83_09845, partial [Cytophagales bacterium]|nr:hypothetical protein [Cytophagales bacterium]